MQREGQRPSLGLLQLPKTKPWEFRVSGLSGERVGNRGYPPFSRAHQVLTLLVPLLPGYVQSCLSCLIHCEG